MKEFMREPVLFDKKIACVSVLAGIIAGLSPMIGKTNCLLIIMLIGGCTLIALLAYNYYCANVLSIFLMSIVLIEPAPFDILFVLLFIFGIVGGYIDFKRIRDRKVILSLFVLYAVINMLQIFYIQHIYGGIRYFGITLYLMAFCLYIFLYVSNRNINGLLMAYIVSGTLSAILGLLGYAGLFPSLLMYDEYRVKAFFKDPNVMGPFLVPSILMLIEDIREKRLIRCHTWIHISLIIINISGLIATFSRGAWVNFFVSVFIYLLLNIKNVNFRRINYYRIIIYAIIGIFVVFLIWNFVLGDEFRQFIYKRVNFQAYDVDRFAAQRAGIALAGVNILGVGPGQFEYSIINHMGVVFSPHNLYIRVLVENGVIGFLIFMSGIVSIFYKLILDFRRNRLYIGITPKALIAILSGIMINSMVIDTLHWRHFWFFLGISMINIRLKDGCIWK